MSEELDYIKDSFTKTEDNVNLEVDNLNVTCITSKNNNFNLDSEGNLTVKTINVNEGALSNLSIVNLIYPIGSVYISINAANPANVFGGVWEQFGSGRCLVGVDTAQTEFNTVEKTGGSKYLQEHYHPTDYYINNGNTMTGGYDKFLKYGMPAGSTYYTAKYKPNVETGNSGNLQPYITCYMWKRTA